jgi:hypothetical protein
MSVYIPVALQRQVRTYFAYRCAYCLTAEHLTVSIFEFEHIIPLSANGSTTFENLCLSCPTCNRYKAQRQRALDPLANESVPLFHPHQQKWEEQYAWDKDGVIIIGLTSTGRATITALKMNRPQLVRVRQLWV